MASGCVHICCFMKAAPYDCQGQGTPVMGTLQGQLPCMHGLPLPACCVGNALTGTLAGHVPACCMRGGSMNQNITDQGAREGAREGASTRDEGADARYTCCDKKGRR